MTKNETWLLEDVGSSWVMERRHPSHVNCRC